MPPELSPGAPSPGAPGSRSARMAATYRLQLHGGFTLDDAAAVVPYLAALGITHCYCSPVFTATPGSTHGYDVCRHTEIGPDLGGDAALATFGRALDAHGLGLVLDFVPNHMSNDPQTNAWWHDVLENGPSSPYARFFDIDWDPIKPELKDRLLLPVLGEPYGEALGRGGLVLRYEAGALRLDYGGLTLPINPRRSPVVFECGLDELDAALGADSAELREFLSILTALRNLPPYTERDARRIGERQREKEIARERLARLTEASPAVRDHIARAVATFNGAAGDRASFDRLHGLLEQQAYRLASWRTAADEINYRRFFDINALAGLRVEDPAVFTEIHGLLLRLLASGRAQGVRLDHVDGLFDPQGYLAALAAAATTATGTGPDTTPPYVVVEKILAVGESLRADWPVAGTTGYEFLNDVNGVLVDGQAAKRMRRAYARLTGRQESFADVAYHGKLLAISTSLSSEFQVLAQAVNRLSERDRRSRDFTLASIRRALREVVACFPVYRTYVGPAGVTRDDALAVDAAIADARRRNPAMESSIFDFLRGVLLPPPTADRVRLDVAMRFQQYTAPVQAKGVEDTAFYRYHVLTSLCEVGGDPGRFGCTVPEFHEANLHRRRQWPAGMLATTTHDTKRSEDARARIAAIAELSDVWHPEVARWRRLNAPNRTRLAGSQAPDANDEYLFYQALAGTWPLEAGTVVAATPTPDLVARLTAYMHKAIKEAKLHTSWITPNADYEAAVTRFVERSLTGRTAPAFLASFLPLVRRLATAGLVNSLAQLVLKLAAPGVPDIYQGTELWDFSLVDPDNRRPVDFAARRQALDDLTPWLAASDTASARRERAAAVAALLAAWPDGRIKLLVTAVGLRLRRTAAEVWVDGDYVPIAATGPAQDHVVAFARTRGARAGLAVVPRLTAHPRGPGLPAADGAWAATALELPEALAGRTFTHAITGEVATAVGRQLPVGPLLATCPVALLTATAPDDSATQ
ncbi:MAG: malto-oligosyltrehalose synthase [Vicinamibacterales bacterium]